MLFSSRVGRKNPTDPEIQVGHRESIRKNQLGWLEIGDSGT